MPYGVVVQLYSSGRLDARHDYLTRDARHLAAETHDGSPLPSVLETMASLEQQRQRGFVAAQLAVSAARDETPTVGQILDLTRDVLAHPAVRVGARPWYSVAHGPPDDDLVHAHVDLSLTDPLTGNIYDTRGLAPRLHAALTDLAPNYGLSPPPTGEATRRRTPRRARSVGVWHGERSRYEWLAERVAPTVLPQIEAAESWAEVAAALGEYGLRYGHAPRGGGAIIDHSADPPAAIAASGLAWSCSLPALEARLGPLPNLPVPGDARANPYAYANDHEGRRLPLGTDAERRAFAEAHAVYRAVWKPVRDERLAEQRAREIQRRAEVRAEVGVLRAARHVAAVTPAELALADAIIDAYADERRTALRSLARDERDAIAALPFGSPPPSRLRDFLRGYRPPADTPRLAGPSRPPLEVGSSAAGLEVRQGLETAELWRDVRRVALDYGKEIVVADPEAASQVFALAKARWGTVAIGGEPPFRAQIEALARGDGTTYTFLPRPPLPEQRPYDDVPAARAIRAATALAFHLGTRLRLDGHPFDPHAPERHPRAQNPNDDRPAWIEFVDPVLALDGVDEATVEKMERVGLRPAARSGEVAVFALDAGASVRERDELARAIAEVYGTRPVKTMDLGGVLYGDACPCEEIQRMLSRRRPALTQQPMTFAQRVNALDHFLRTFEPSPAWAAPPPEPIVVEPAERGRKRKRRR